MRLPVFGVGRAADKLHVVRALPWASRVFFYCLCLGSGFHVGSYDVLGFRLKPKLGLGQRSNRGALWLELILNMKLVAEKSPEP